MTRQHVRKLEKAKAKNNDGASGGTRGQSTPSKPRGGRAPGSGKRVPKRKVEEALVDDDDDGGDSDEEVKLDDEKPHKARRQY
jgi:hypothetical protein